MRRSHEEEFEYDVAPSLADEDQWYVAPVAGRLRDAGARVFYDEFKQAEMG